MVKYAIISIIIYAVCMAFLPGTSAQEEVQYKKFTLDDVSCDVGISYKESPDGMDIGVSAIATGRGAEFRHWKITDMKLHIGGDRVKPGKTDKFFVKEESFMRIPAAILFAALGTQIDVGGSDLEKGIAKTGMAVGLGLLVLQAQGDIAGERGVFKLDKALKDKISEGQDEIVIVVENTNIHERKTINIGIVKPVEGRAPKIDYGSMSKDALSKMADDLETRIRVLKDEQASYRYGEDPKYDELEERIEELQTEHALAYNARLRKESE